jgi:hypothetical protein
VYESIAVDRGWWPAHSIRPSFRNMPHAHEVA